MTDWCNKIYDGFGTECQRCGSWTRGRKWPECPPYITRMEPDGERLPHIKTHEQNKAAWITWSALEEFEHPLPKQHTTAT